MKKLILPLLLIAGILSCEKSTPCHIVHTQTICIWTNNQDTIKVERSEPIIDEICLSTAEKIYDYSDARTYKVTTKWSCGYTLDGTFYPNMIQECKTLCIIF